MKFSLVFAVVFCAAAVAFGAAFSDGANEPDWAMSPEQHFSEVVGVGSWPLAGGVEDSARYATALALGHYAAYFCQEGEYASAGDIEELRREVAAGRVWLAVRAGRLECHPSWVMASRGGE